MCAGPVDGSSGGAGGDFLFESPFSSSAIASDYVESSIAPSSSSVASSTSSSPAISSSYVSSSVSSSPLTSSSTSSSPAISSSHVSSSISSSPWTSSSRSSSSSSPVQSSSTSSSPPVSSSTSSSPVISSSSSSSLLLVTSSARSSTSSSAFSSSSSSTSSLISTAGIVISAPTIASPTLSLPFESNYNSAVSSVVATANNPGSCLSFPVVALPSGSLGTALTNECGSNPAPTLTPTPALNWTANFTISIWFNIDVAVIDTHQLWYLLYSAGSGQFLSMSVTNNLNNAVVGIQHGAVNIGGKCSTSCIGQWCHLFYTYDVTSSSAMFFCNATLVGSGSGLSNTWATATQFQTMQIGYAANTWIGQLYHFQFWNSSMLSASSALAVFNADLGLPASTPPACAAGTFLSTNNQCLASACINGLALPMTCLGCVDVSASSWMCTACAGSFVMNPSMQCVAPAFGTAALPNTGNPTTTNYSTLFSDIAFITRPPLTPAQPTPAHIALDVHVTDTADSWTISPFAAGLSFEYDVFTMANMFNASYTEFVSLMQLITGNAGLMRIGGNTVGATNLGVYWNATGQTGNATIVTDLDNYMLGQFVNATNLNLLIGLPVGFPPGIESPSATAANVASLQKYLGNRLYAVQIGNEPSSSYTNMYSQTWAGIVLNETALLPSSVSISGPALDEATISWLDDFLQITTGVVSVADAHYYMTNPAGNTPFGMISQGMPNTPAPYAQSVTPVGFGQAMFQVGMSNGGMPIRTSETNTYAGGGVGGLSNSHASAFWLPNYVFTLMQFGFVSASFHVGIYYGAFVVHESCPGSCGTIGPIYPFLYSFMALRQVMDAGGPVSDVCTMPQQPSTFAAYSARVPGAGASNYTLLLLNWDPVASVNATIHLPYTGQQYSVAYLASTTGQLSSLVSQLAGAQVTYGAETANVTWLPSQIFLLPAGSTTVYVPSNTLALVRAEPMPWSNIQPAASAPIGVSNCTGGLYSTAQAQTQGRGRTSAPGSSHFFPLESSYTDTHTGWNATTTATLVSPQCTQGFVNTTLPSGMAGSTYLASCYGSSLTTPIAATANFSVAMWVQITPKGLTQYSPFTWLTTSGGGELIAGICPLTAGGCGGAYLTFAMSGLGSTNLPASYNPNGFNPATGGIGATGGCSNTFQPTCGSANLSTWNHYALSFGSNPDNATATIMMWINGVQVYRNQSVPSSVWAQQPAHGTFQVGLSGSYPRTLTGNVWHLWTWNYAVDNATIAMVYSKGVTSGTTALSSSSSSSSPTSSIVSSSSSTPSSSPTSSVRFSSSASSSPATSSSVPSSSVPSAPTSSASSSSSPATSSLTSSAASATNSYVFILAGQSNMVGENGDGAPNPPYNTPWQYPTITQLGRFPPYNFVVMPGADPLQFNQSAICANNTVCAGADVGPGMSFAAAYTQATGNNITLVPCAVPGTGFSASITPTCSSSNQATDFWNPMNNSDNGCSLFYDCLTRANFLLAQPGYTMGGILWVQGEGNEATAGPYYLSSVQNMVATFRSQLIGATNSTPFVAGSMNPNWAQSQPDWPIIQNVINSYPLTINYSAVTWGYSPNGESFPSGAETVHYMASAQRAIGEYMYLAYQTALLNSPTGVTPGPIIQLFVRQLNSSTCSVWWVPDPIATSYQLWNTTSLIVTTTATTGLSFSRYVSAFTTQTFRVRGVGPTGVFGTFSQPQSCVYGPATYTYTALSPYGGLAPAFWVVADTYMSSFSGMTTWEDISGNYNYLYAMGAPVSLQSGVYDGHNAVAFANSSLQSFGGFPTQSDFTIVMVVSTTTLLTQASAFLFSASCETMYLAVTNQVYFTVNGGTFGHSLGAVPASGAPTVLTVTWSNLGQNGTFYLNGVFDTVYAESASDLAGAAAGNNSIANSIISSQFAIGADATAQYPFAGLIFEVLIYNFSMTTAQVSTVATALSTKYLTNTSAAMANAAYQAGDPIFQAIPPSLWFVGDSLAASAGTPVTTWQSIATSNVVLNSTYANNVYPVVFANSSSTPHLALNSNNSTMYVATGFPSAHNLTCFFVIATEEASHSTLQMIGWGNNRIQLLNRNYPEYYQSPTTFQSSGNIAYDGTPFMITFQYLDAVTNVSWWLNGAQAGLNMNSSFSGSNTGVSITLGQAGYQVNYYEIIVINQALNTSTRHTIESALATKYNISSYVAT